MSSFDRVFFARRVTQHDFRVMRTARAGSAICLDEFGFRHRGNKCVGFAGNQFRNLRPARGHRDLRRPGRPVEEAVIKLEMVSAVALQLAFQETVEASLVGANRMRTRSAGPCSSDISL